MNRYENNQNLQVDEELDEQQPLDVNNENRLNEKTRASIWLALAVTVFLCAVVMCLSLIRKSAETSVHKPIQQHVADIQYADAVNTEQTQNPSVSDPEGTTEPSRIAAKFNYLLAAIDHETERTDMLMLLNVDTVNATIALLSIPRDTYVFGSYDVPKINRVYDEKVERSADALLEATENMMGFELDGYLLFDEISLESVLTSLGGIEFEVPEEPDYHTLIPGEQMLSDIEAFGLFRYHEDYTDVETESCRVQRDFMIKILDRLLQDQERLYDHAQLICETATTNISAETLVYFGNQLKDFRAEDAYEAALPGDEINVDGESFYQVDVEKACEYLNAYFNPMDEDLTEFSVNFRQKYDDSGIGEMPDWVPGNTSGNTSGNTDRTGPTEDTTEEPTEEPTEDTTQEPTEEPTQGEDTSEPPSEEPTEEPTQSEEPTETSTQTPEPLEPAEPSGD